MKKKTHKPFSAHKQEKTGEKCHLQPCGQHGYQSILPSEAQAEPVSSKAELFNIQEHKQGPAFSDEAQLCSAHCGQLSSMCDRTMIYLHGFEILRPKMTECRQQVARNKQASSRASFLCQAHWMSLIPWFMYQEGMFMKTDMSTLSQRGQRRLLCGSSPETGIDLHSWYCLISRDPGNMGCTMLIAPFAQELFSRWREDIIFVSFHSFLLFPHTISLFLLFFL